MLLIKACPRCQGDVTPIVDFEGDLQLSCVQCGYSKYVPRGRRPDLAEAKPVVGTLRRAS
ncbi:MAG: hypothetical protein K1X87_10205 [Dehalococcoidia bacterium]|nr:hypothetical protein [Dehalococcoidia bacterium]HRC61826.1 hypothetical protein [Dehalococcoidia bacterium]